MHFDCLQHWSTWMKIKLWDIYLFGGRHSGFYINISPAAKILKEQFIKRANPWVLQHFQSCHCLTNNVPKCNASVVPHAWYQMYAGKVGGHPLDFLTHLISRRSLELDWSGVHVLLTVHNGPKNLAYKSTKEVLNISYNSRYGLDYQTFKNS